MKAARRSIPMLLGVALIVGRITYAQSYPALVEGRVMCSDGNVPARGANVQLVPLETLLPSASQEGRTSKSAVSTKSDFLGIYSIMSVAPGNYIVNVTLDGYEDDLSLVRATLNRYTLDQQKSLLAALPQIDVKVDGIVH